MGMNIEQQKAFVNMGFFAYPPVEVYCTPGIFQKYVRSMTMKAIL
jgi:hypothetical protein